MNFEDIILKNILKDDEYSRKVIPYLDLDFFEPAHKIIFKEIAKYYVKYNCMPNKEALGIEIQNTNIPDNLLSEVSSIYNDITADYKESEKPNKKWLIDETEKWCLTQSSLKAVLKCAEIINGKSKEPLTAMPDILQKAVNISFDNNIGHDYFEAAASRFEYYKRSEEHLPFAIDILNKITNGGLTNKSLTVILAGTGVGKSMFMCDLAANAISMGKNVVYFSMEMSEEKVAKRIDANLFNINIKNIDDWETEKLISKIDQLKTKTNGKLIIKEFPTSSAHAGHMRAILEDLKTKKNIVPDLVIVDYLNICASSRIKSLGGSVNSYNYIKAIAEEIRALAQEYNVPIVTATQTTREGSKNSDLELSDTSECIHVDEKVQLRDGTIKRIGDVVVGDQITSYDGYKTTVLVHHKKLKDCVKVKTKSGKEIIVSKDHVFPTNKGRVSVNSGLNVGMRLHTKNEIK